jgi:hypothetical protein
MTSETDRLESALRAVYATREARPTEDLRSRLDAVPVSTSAAWSPVRRGFAVMLRLIAAGAFVLAVLSAVRNLPRLLAPPPGVGAAALFDPVHPGGGLVALTGVTFDGLTFAALVGAVLLGLGFLWWVVVGVFVGRKPKPKPPTTRRERLLNLLWFAFFGVVTFARPYVIPREVVTAGSFAGGGMGLVETRNDGASAVEHVGGGFSITMDGPRNVHAVRPGEPLTYLVSVRNALPVGIRLVGRWADSTAFTDATEPRGSSPTGLGLLRDPRVFDPTPENTVSFVPVDLDPGEEVTVVVAEVGRPCADPTALLSDRSGWIPGRTSDFAPTIQFVYEVFGIEGVASLILRPEITVPSTCPAAPS